MSNEYVKKGERGDEVKSLQNKLIRLGFKLEADGIFGGATDEAVRELQTLFGYTIDGIVGPGTSSLIDAQIGYGWNYTAPDAKQRAMAAQGKTMEPAAAAKGAPAAAPAKAAPTSSNVPKKG